MAAAVYIAKRTFKIARQSILAGIALSSIQAGAFDPGYAGYGGFFLPAGVLAWWRDATSPGPALAGMLAGGAAAPERPEPGRQWRC